MAEIEIKVLSNIDGENRWRLETNQELVLIDLLPSMDFPNANLKDLVSSGALFEIGNIIVGCLSVFKQVTTHFDPDSPNAIEFTIVDIEPEVVRSIFNDIIFNQMALSIAFDTGMGVSANFA